MTGYGSRREEAAQTTRNRLCGVPDTRRMVSAASSLGTCRCLTGHVAVVPLIHAIGAPQEVCIRATTTTTTAASVASSRLLGNLAWPNQQTSHWRTVEKPCDVRGSQAALKGPHRDSERAKPRRPRRPAAIRRPRSSSSTAMDGSAQPRWTPRRLRSPQRPRHQLRNIDHHPGLKRRFSHDSGSQNHVHHVHHGRRPLGVREFRPSCIIDRWHVRGSGRVHHAFGDSRRTVPAR